MGNNKIALSFRSTELKNTAVLRLINARHNELTHGSSFANQPGFAPD